MPHGLSGNVCCGSKKYSLYQNDEDENRYYLGKSNHLHTTCDENTQSEANKCKKQQNQPRTRKQTKYAPDRRDLKIGIQGHLRSSEVAKRGHKYIIAMSSGINESLFSSYLIIRYWYPACHKWPCAGSPVMMSHVSDGRHNYYQSWASAFL